MSKPFAIVTDTGHNVPPEIVRDLQLQEVPFTINATLETTKYLLKSGRARSILHLLSSVLNIRPIISLRGGVVVLFGRVRGRMDKAIESIVEDVCKTRNLGRISVVEGIAPDLKEALIQRLTRVLNVTREQIVESKIGPSFLIHTGKRVVGVVWGEKA